jgi:hypothetical protein
VRGRQDLVERFREGATAVKAAVQGLRDGEADACEGPGEWTVRQIVHHLADTELMRGARLFQLLVDDQPTIQGFDEGAFARRLHYERDIQSSVVAFCALRESLASLVEQLSEEEWSRGGVHSEINPYTVETMIRRGIDHAREHTEQIRRARSRWASAA